MPTVPRYDDLQVPVQPRSGALRVPDVRPMQGLQQRPERGRLQVPTLEPPASRLPTVQPVDVGQVQPVRQGDQGALISAAGEALGRAANTALNVMAYRESRANRARVVDALNQVKDAELRLTYDPKQGFMAARGMSALQRDSGKPLADEYRDTLADQVRKIREGLGNDQQREMFDEHAPAIVSNLFGRALAHEAEQQQQYEGSVQQGGIRTAQQEIGLRWHELDTIDQGIQRIAGFVNNIAAATGKSPQWAAAETTAQTSAAVRIAAEQALEEREPAKAAEILARYSKAMQPDDLLAVRGKLEREQSILTGMGAAQTIWTRNQPMTQFDALHEAMIGQESGGRQFGSDGQVLTSKAGALGVGQFMPDTARMVAQQHGIPFDLDRLKTDADYNRNLSRLHLQDLLTQFGGDPRKALAAYNAGAGAVTKAERAGGDWLAHMPAETRAYVPSIMAKFERTNTTGQRPTLADLDQQARDYPALANNPEALQHAQQDLARRAQLDAQAFKQREAEGYAAALDALRKNGGDWNSLPPSIRDAVPADKVDEAMRYGHAIGKGEPVTTDMALYGGLVAAPQQLAKLTDAEFAALGAKIAPDDLKHLANLRAKAINPETPESKDPGNLNTTAITQTLDNRLSLIGIDPRPKAHDTTALERIGAIRQFVDRSVSAAQREAGRKFNDAETADHIDRLFAQNTTIQGWFSDSSAPMLSMQAGDIPSADRKGIKAAFERAGISDPTDAQILGAYWQAKGGR